MEEYLFDLKTQRDIDRIKGIIESILFVSGEAVLKKDLINVLNIYEKDFEWIIKEMIDEYENEKEEFLYWNLMISFSFLQNLNIAVL